ncbi:hypothetical protein L9F63_000683, partial [Diploptera punctata]
LVGSDEILRIYYFLGPSSARRTDLSRYLKPMVPFNYKVPDFTKKHRKKHQCFHATFGFTI